MTLTQKHHTINQIYLFSIVYLKHRVPQPFTGSDFLLDIFTFQPLPKLDMVAVGDSITAVSKRNVEKTTKDNIYS